MSYRGEAESIAATYKQLHENQTLAHVRHERARWRATPRPRHRLPDLFRQLDAFVDASDPDTDLPQTVHSLQACEAMHALKVTMPVADLFADDEWRGLPPDVQHLYQHKSVAELVNRGRDQPVLNWSFLPVVAFIHDIGKVLAVDGAPQWSVVGDTFPLGCPLHPSVQFFDRHFYKSNPDLDPEKFENVFGKYSPRVGFEHLEFSVGHDDYLADRLAHTSLPPEAVYMIRFHSFYAWHTPPQGKARGYAYFASARDWRLLPLLKLLQRADLYSKTDAVPDVDLDWLYALAREWGVDKI